MVAVAYMVTLPLVHQNPTVLSTYLFVRLQIQGILLIRNRFADFILLLASLPVDVGMLQTHTNTGEILSYGFQSCDLRMTFDTIVGVIPYLFQR